jgi:hypothetical protein
MFRPHRPAHAGLVLAGLLALASWHAAAEEAFCAPVEVYNTTSQR